MNAAGKLGFGLMRLPKKDDGKIDIDQTKAMVDMFLDAGFDYFDTAWAYEGSEDAIREALVERYPRESFRLATKNASWIKCKTREDAIDQFEASLERTGAGYFDNYLLHNLGGNRTHFFDDFGMWDFVREKKAEGKIRHYGISVHCTWQELDGILSAHPDIEFVQLQINYADWEDRTIQSRLCYETARKHGKPVIVMEPVKGGLLANPPDSVKEMFSKMNDWSPAAWALRFAAGLEGVDTVLSGMSDIAQMEENIGVLKGFEGLTEAESETIAAARDEMSKMPMVPCTACGYCEKVCPENIGIKGTFFSANILTMYGDKAAAQHQEGWNVAGQGKARANLCIKCGKCEDACPQGIEIRDELAKAVAELGIE